MNMEVLSIWLTHTHREKRRFSAFQKSTCRTEHTESVAHAPDLSEKRGLQVTYGIYIFAGATSKTIYNFYYGTVTVFSGEKAKCVTRIPFNFLNDSGDEPE